MYLERMDNECRYAFLSPAELRSRLDEKAILYLPIGSLEWHNEHLPLGTDTFIAIELCMRLCREVGGVVLPAFWWNTGGCHDHESTYHMPEEHYRSALKSVCMGLAPIPARLLVLVNGHGGTYQADSPAIVAGELNADAFPMRVLAADPYRLRTSCSFQIDHADTAETSVAMELVPQLVRMERPIGPDLYSGKKPFAAKPPAKELGEEFRLAYLSEAGRLIEKEYQDACARRPASLPHVR